MLEVSTLQGLCVVPFFASVKYLNGVSYLLTPTYLTLFMLLCVPSTDSSTRLEISWIGVGDRSLGGGEFPVARARDGDRMRA